MAQSLYTIENGPGASVRSALNDLFEAIATNNSGQSEPDPVFPYMIWPDTNAGLIRQRNGSNTSWVTIGSLSGSTWIPYRDGSAQGTASTRDVGTGSGSNLLDRDQLDGRLMRRSQNGVDIQSASAFRDNIDVYSRSQTYSTGQADSAIDARASNISQSDLNSNSVGQSQLRTTTGTSSVSASGSNGDETSTISIPGGGWAFASRVRYQTDNASLSSGTWNLTSDATTSYVRRYTIRSQTESGPVSATTQAQTRYVQSSPPYDHGDGIIEGYDYAEVDSQGRVTALYLAEDPPWYGNTQHTPISQWRDKKTGKEYQRTRRLKCCLQDVRVGKISMAEFIERAGECEDVVEEITSETKLRGMEELPHPFEEKPDRTIVLLDPMDELTGKLIRMMQAGESVHQLFTEDYLRVDNEPCKRCGPPGVAIHKARWKRT